MRKAKTKTQLTIITLAREELLLISCSHVALALCLCFSEDSVKVPLFSWSKWSVYQEKESLRYKKVNVFALLHNFIKDFLSTWICLIRHLMTFIIRFVFYFEQTSIIIVFENLPRGAGRAMGKRWNHCLIRQI